MKGFPLHLFDERLEVLQKDETLFPISVRDKMVERLGTDGNLRLVDTVYKEEWKNILARLPIAQLLRLLTFQELARILYTDIYFFADEVREQIEKLPKLVLLKKIQNSFWKWGNNGDDTTWGMAISLYGQMCSFSVDLEGFTAHLDWTTGYNHKGYSTSTRIFLDGVFAYLIHYRGEHVMTVGFSFTDKGELLISQVQLVKKKGNRFLYHLPVRYVDWVVALMRKNFTGRKAYIVDGGSLALHIYQSYSLPAQNLREEFSNQRRFIYANMKEANREVILNRLACIREDYKACWRKALNFKAKDFTRIVSIYPSAEGKKTIRRNELLFSLLSKKPT